MAMTAPHTPQSTDLTYREPTIRERFQELNAASSREAAVLAVQGKKAGPWGLVFAPALTFLRTYFGGSEWRRGVAGLVVASFAAYEVFVRYAKLWELDHNQSPSLLHKGSKAEGPSAGEGKKA
jgi:hypothetical protein